VRFARVESPNGPAFAIVEDERVRLIDGTPFEPYTPALQTLSIRDAKFLAPVVPAKVIAVGLNYRAHAAELGMDVPTEPILFMKPPTAIIGTRETIVLPSISDRVEYEAELAVVIGREGKAIAESDAADHILGYTCANDVTARDLQQRDGQWTRSKGFDTFCPLGPWIETEFDPADAPIKAVLNGDTRQSSTTADFLFGVGYLVAHISAVMTLLPGDVILTGTPPGVGIIRPGDTIAVSIDGIGSLINGVTDVRDPS
jgi:2-keto-4-pentenoate hydratase/2-oxohepta-3-ene-1,7-dioic acid hydratase in catechol pathway